MSHKCIKTGRGQWRLLSDYSIFSPSWCVKEIITYFNMILFPKAMVRQTLWTKSSSILALHHCDWNACIVYIKIWFSLVENDSKSYFLIFSMTPSVSLMQGVSSLSLKHYASPSTQKWHHSSHRTRRDLTSSLSCSVSFRCSIQTTSDRERSTPCKTSSPSTSLMITTPTLQHPRPPRYHQRG